MQARMRRNRIALPVLLASALLFTSTCEFQGNGLAMQRSGAADMVYAATTGSDVNLTEEQAVSGALESDCAPSTKKSETYDVTEWWKADISDYDQSLSLIRYEAAAAQPDPLTTTIAVTTDTTEVTTTTTTSTEETTTTTTTVVTTLEAPAIRATTTVCAPANSVVFYTYGYGHGVGMSQNGANFYAKYKGYSYKQILSHYYPGTTLVNTGVDPNKRITIGNCTGDIVSVISQVVYLEMGPSMATEALKAQAVAIYSFYLNHNGGSGLKGKRNPPQNIVNAVKSVVGQAIYYNGKPADAMFYASSGGATASCKDIFNMDIPYLRSIDVEYDESCDPHYCDAQVFSVKQLKAKLEARYNVKLSGSPYDWIKLNYGDGGYVASAVIGGKVTVKGNALRTALGLKSPKFEFVYQQGSTPPPATLITTAAQPETTQSEISTTTTTTTTAAPAATTESESVVASESTVSDTTASEN